MTNFAASFSGRPAYSYRLEISVYSQDIPNNRTRLNVRAYHRHDTSASNGTYDYASGSWSFNAGGQTGSGPCQFLMGPSGDYVGKEITLYSGITGWIDHDPDGTKTISVSGSSGTWSPPGSATIGATNYDLPDIPRAPGAPTLDSITDIAVSSFRTNFTAPSDIGGGAITGYTTRVALDDIFTSPTEFAGSATPIDATSLTPGTLYYAQVKATNAYGDGPWSNTRSATTADAGAPHIMAVRSWKGDGFYVNTSLPFGVGSVTDYTIRRTVTGPGAPGVVEWTTASATSFDALVLAAGQSVQYQALATVASVDTAFSGSVTLDYVAVVPKAPMRPIFDGASVFTAPFVLETTDWAGSANASVSYLYGRHPKGWRTFAQGAASLAAGVVSQISKALALLTSTGDYDVMAVFASVQSGAGVRVGTSITGADLMAVVYESVTYYGSIKVLSDVQTIMACEIEWYGSDFSLISRTRGTTSILAAGVASELQVSGAAPSGAAYAAVASVDVTGAEWTAGSLRFCGSAQLTASARYPLFDGDTAADTSYEYAWLGEDNASASQRISLGGSGGALVDPEDPVVPLPPTPPVIETDAVLTDIVWRRYVTAIPATDVREWIVSVPKLYIHANEVAEREVRIRYWRNPFEVEPTLWTDGGADPEAEQVISYIPAQATFIIDGVLERARVAYDAEPDDLIEADHLLYGDGGGPATWPLLDCGTAYIVTFDVPLTATDGNLDISLELTDRLL